MPVASRSSPTTSNKNATSKKKKISTGSTTAPKKYNTVGVTNDSRKQCVYERLNDTTSNPTKLYILKKNAEGKYNYKVYTGGVRVQKGGGLFGMCTTKGCNNQVVAPQRVNSSRAPQQRRAYKGVEKDFFKILQGPIYRLDIFMYFDDSELIVNTYHFAHANDAREFVSNYYMEGTKYVLTKLTGEQYIGTFDKHNEFYFTNENIFDTNFLENWVYKINYQLKQKATWDEIINAGLRGQRAIYPTQ